ncbi:hypothetical protein BC941DRAFT_431675 [Chlamydoabsidia padenii]|nr:hypothetical protein BC941DRAFT_431675 [Chlamydoabsidia padenii]
MDCVHLRQINLYNCHALTNASLMTLLQQCPQLEQLSLAGAYTITVSCFLDKQILCPQLRTLNLKMLPGFFCLSSPQKRWSSAPFPKLQELKLGDNYINNELPNLLALLLQRCANITRLSVDSLQYNPLIPKSLRPKALDICLDQVPHLTWVTLCKFIFQPGTLTQLLTSRKLERLELECIDVRTLNELEVGDYSRLTGLKLSPMIVPPGLLTRIISAAPLLTRINCLHIDDDAWTILKNYPLTHLTTSRLPALDYLTAWQNSLVWLEIKGVKQVHKYSVVDFLCTWDNHIQVLLLDGFNLTTTDLQRLARSFTHTRYLSFNAEGTDNTAEDVELALRDWTCLKGVLCANEEELMAENDETWLDWECMDAWRTQFFRWEQKDQIS